MKTTMNQVLSSPSTRRRFLKSAGALALAAPTVIAGQPRPMSEPSQWWHCRNGIELLAEGIIPNLPVTPAIPWVFPPIDSDPTTPELNPMPPGVEARLRVTIPAARGRRLLAVQVYLILAGTAELPNPEAPPLDGMLPAQPQTLSCFEMEVADIAFGTSPVPGSAARMPSFGVYGKVTNILKASPFGDLLGSPCMVSASFGPVPVEGLTDFVFLSAACAGNHVSMAPAGKGILSLRK